MGQHSMEFRKKGKKKKKTVHESTRDSVKIDGEISRFGMSSTLPTIDELTTYIHVLLE